MSDLAEFLLARIAEDEQTATSARDAGQVYPHYGDDVVDEFAEMAVQEGCREQVAVHLRRFGPARVLADLEAKRAIVEKYRKCITPDADGYADHREDDGFGWFDEDRKYHHGRIGMEYSDGHFVALRDVCLALVQVYAEHPDFDPAWRAEVTA